MTQHALPDLGDICFYLGTHEAHWLWNTAADFPLFVSHWRLARYKTLHPATSPLAIDSGGFSALRDCGTWPITPAEYVRAIARYDRELGHLDWAAPMDWMCEPAIIHGGTVSGMRFAGTHLSVNEHQHRTVENFLQLRELWPAESDEDCPFMPVLQGWTVDDYQRCAEMYGAAGVALEEYPLTGLGSVCRRQGTGEIGHLVEMFTPWLALHAFGVKTLGLMAYGHRLTSADSLAWSYDARRSAPMPGHTHKNCANCLPYAARWRDRTLRRLAETEPQDCLPFWEEAA
jgi:hypothetical protein